MIKSWGVRMPRDYRDPAASPCLSATGAAGGPVQGTWDLHRRNREAEAATCREGPAEDFSPACFNAPCTCVSPSARRYSLIAEVIEVLYFTSARVTFHGIVQNVSRFIRPNFTRESSLEAKTTFTVGNKSRSPWPRPRATPPRAWSSIHKHTYLIYARRCVRTSGHYATVHKSV